MKNLSLIAAIGKNNELGLDNRLIWHIKEDLSFYRSMTIGKNIIMGRKTFESMPAGALKKRTPFVLSRTIELDKFYDVNYYNNIDELLNYIDISKEEFVVVGGAVIYKEFMPYVDTMYLTQILQYHGADTYFPKFDIKDWNIEIMDNYCKEEIPYIRKKYIRKKYIRKR